MLIVEIVGGLGNQMFQYAFYHKLKKHHKDSQVKIYLKRFGETPDNQGYELGNVFGISQEPIVYDKDVSNLIDDSVNFISRVKRKILGRKKTFYLEQIFRYDSKVFSQKNNQVIYFRGLWQDELYFSDLRNELLEVFHFRTDNLDNCNLQILKQIKQSNSVSIHIRRGDYISNEKYNNILGGVCTYRYYKEALEYLQSKVESTSLFVFSDDIDWVKSEFDFFEGKKVTYVSGNFGKESYIDMYLMTMCKHNIIANSSFSWWGAWLNKNELKIVLAPEKWFKNNRRLEDNNIVPSTWTKVKN